MAKKTIKQVKKRDLIYTVLLLVGPLSFDELAKRVIINVGFVKHTSLEQLLHDLRTELQTDPRFNLRKDNTWGLVEFRQLSQAERIKLQKVKNRKINFTSIRKLPAQFPQKVRFWRNST